MIRKILFPVLLFLVSCNAPNPPANTVKTKTHSKPEPVAPKPSPGPWIVKNYVDAGGEPTARKYARLDAVGTFSNSNVSNGYLYAVFLLNKENAGILLHQSEKSSPAEKFTGLVRIKMKNTSGEELELTSSRGWNKSGGILIEQNNNDYSRFRIFMLRSEGAVNVEIHDDSSSVYNFSIYAAGFSDALSQI